MRFHLAIFATDIQDTLIPPDCNLSKSNSFFVQQNIQEDRTEMSLMLKYQAFSGWFYLKKKKGNSEFFFFLSWWCAALVFLEFSPRYSGFLCRGGEISILFIVIRVPPTWPFSLLQFLELFFSCAKFFSTNVF